MIQNPLLIVLGPTASGKTSLAVNLANHLDGEIISADSRQIFKQMDIGTGKDLDAYEIDGKTIKSHLIDIKEPGEKYHVNAFKEDFFAAFNAINQQKKMPILCGGTAMYIHTILQNQPYTAVPINQQLRDNLLNFDKTELQQKLALYPSQLREKADYSSAKRLMRAIEIADFLSNNQLIEKERPSFTPLVIGLQSDTETRRKKILDRLNARLNAGLIEEVEQLLANGVSKEMLIFYGLEYKFVVNYLNGEINFDTLKERLGIAICQFAKRQMTFFRKMEKDGVQINWLNAVQPASTLCNEALGLVNAKFKK